MTKKKLRSKLAKELRWQYDFGFVESIKIAKALLVDQIDTTNILLDLGYEIEREQIPTCGRGCCYEWGESFYSGTTEKNQYREFKYKDLKRILENVSKNKKRCL